MSNRAKKDVGWLAALERQQPAQSTVGTDTSTHDVPASEPEWLRLGLAKSAGQGIGQESGTDTARVENLIDSEHISVVDELELPSDASSPELSRASVPEQAADSDMSQNSRQIDESHVEQAITSSPLDFVNWIPAADVVPPVQEINEPQQRERFVPQEPADLDASGLNTTIIERLIIRILLQKTTGSGREIADSIRLPFRIVEPVFNLLRQQRFIAYKSNVAMADYVYELTELGHDRARRETEYTSYSGAAPVAFDDYVEGVRAQSISGTRVGFADLCTAFDGLQISNKLLGQIGQAVNSGEGLFLYGSPGNGKTSIAERIARAFGTGIWIPRALLVSGQIIRLFDSSNHVPIEPDHLDADFKPDRRWVFIKRPSIVVGGELTLEDLEVHFNPTTGVSEAPLHIKANGGVMVIDDFGRQRLRPAELLNRWIVPLEKHYDFFTLQSGQQVKVPCEQVVVFSTNLDPSELVDEAFLRRIPYKIEVTDPDPLEFRDVLRSQAIALGFGYSDAVARYLIETHYLKAGRPLRFCHPRDLLLQIRNLCRFRDLPLQMSEELFDTAIANYFGNLGMGKFS